MLFRTRDLPVRQRTPTADALRGHLAEHGVVAPQGIANVARLAAAVDDPEMRLPETVRDLGRELLEQIGILDAKVGKLDAEVRKRGEGERRSEAFDGHPGNRSRLCHGDPGLRAADGGLPARARLLGSAPVPRQCSTGGKPKLGRISKMGQRDLRRLPVAGAIAVIR